jgi:apolipoprotein N-acyltransferase
MLGEAESRYIGMTRIAAHASPHPRLIVWPETVIPLYGLNQDPPLIARLTKLARTSNATIVVGSIEASGANAYNALFFFTPNGLQATYDKRQLVPFAEHFPGKSFLWWLPYIGELNGKFSEGTVDGVYPTTAGLSVAPLICWESAFGDLAYRQIRNGAQVLMVTTDDAWFGTTSGPYQHAQIAQMRAIEAGAYVVRAAATGISGVIAPDGTWTSYAGLEKQTIVSGRIGPRIGSVFSHIGPNAVAALLALLYISIVLIPWRVHNAR